VALLAFLRPIDDVHQLPGVLKGFKLDVTIFVLADSKRGVEHSYSLVPILIVDLNLASGYVIVLGTGHIPMLSEGSRPIREKGDLTAGGRRNAAYLTSRAVRARSREDS
jgi:hypothetical protein